MAKKASQSKKETAAKNASGKKADVSILRHPRVTEKAAKASGMSVYVFDVAPTATKNEIAKAFEVAYKHAPLRVHTLIKKPLRRVRRTNTGNQIGFASKVKKAYIYLPKGTSIDVM